MSDSFRQVGDDVYSSTDYKRRIVFGEKWTGTYTIEGDRAELLTIMPERGATMETIATIDILVTDAEIDDLGAGLSARLTVTAVATPPESTYTDPLGDAQFQIEFAEVRRKLETHPLCGGLSTAGIEAGKSLENWEQLVTGDYEVATNIPDYYTGMTAWTLAEYKSLRAAGQEEYVVYLPTVIRTLKYLARPSGVGSACGKRQSPPTSIFTDEDDYSWLAGPDSLTRRGREYERTTKWSGVPKPTGTPTATQGWSSIVYPAA